ncbi:MAG: zf-HC2 domain-containing protein [Oscillospiraceae bacterium]|nr:zf-HC2 domain-containing protein [Oscillospiraceae bacterium]
MNHKEYKEQLSALLDNELDEEAREEVLRHLSACEECQSYFEELSDLHDAMSGWEELDPPADFAEGVLARLHEEGTAAAVSETARQDAKKRRQVFGALAACAAVLLLVTVPRFFSMGGSAPATASSVQYTAGSESAAAGAKAEAPEAVYQTEEAAAEAAEESPMMSLRSAPTEAAGSTANAAPEAVNDAAAKQESLDGGAEAPILTLSGAGAEDWLQKHCFDDLSGDGFYVVSAESLRELPKGLTLGDAAAVARWQQTGSDFATLRAAETGAGA